MRKTFKDLKTLGNISRDDNYFLTPIKNHKLCSDCIQFFSFLIVYENDLSE